MKKKSSTKEDEVKKYAEMAKKIPDVRSKKVSKIKKQIKEGTYNVTPEVVADSIIDSHKELVSDKKSGKKLRK